MEHNFTLGKSFVTDNIEEAFITNKRPIKGHMFANELTATTIRVTQGMHSE